MRVTLPLSVHSFKENSVDACRGEAHKKWEPTQRRYRSFIQGCYLTFAPMAYIWIT